jgi:UPF0755 protein
MRRVQERRPATFLTTIALIASGSLVLGMAACGTADAPRTIEVTVPAGATFDSVLDTLVTRGVVDAKRRFRLYARVTGADRRVRAGSYELVPDASWGEILEALTSGRVMTFGMTIPEGFTIADMAPRVAETVERPADSVRAWLTDPDAHLRWDVPGPGLEGYLFPDTYRFARGVALDVVIEAMVSRYQTAWTSGRRGRLEELEMSENQLMTLASIIQAEARRVEEMPTISAVYHNRLRLGYRLQADPTVLYALGGRRERLLFAAIDSVADNPYNTYTQRGLPPGPIAAAGEAAIHAALYPADESYLYFVARPDGSHIFTRSLEEHNRAREVARTERSAIANR